MADGTVGYTEGAGKNVAVDDLGVGGLAQRLKIVIGGSGVDGGDVAQTNPLPATLVDALGVAIDPRLIRAIASGTDSIAVPNVDVLLSTRLKPADTLAGVTLVTNLAQLGGQAVAMGTGVRSAGTQRVTVATDDLVPVSDAGGSLTIDAPVGTPAFVRLSDGAATLVGSKTSASSLPVVIASDQAAVSMQGGKTNNNAAPGATNLGVIAALANAGIQAWTEGNQVLCSVDLGGALRVTNRPMVVLGGYRVQAMTGIYTALAAGAILLSARWGDATRLCLPLRVRVFMNTTTAATAAGMHDRDLVIVRGFTASDTGQTAITLTGNNQKMRTSQGASLFTDMRIAGTAAIAAGTGTADAQAIGLTGKQGTATEPIGLTLPPEDLYVCNAEQAYPIVLVQNEGFRVRIPTAQPATVAQRTSIRVEWIELAAGAY